MYRRHSIRIVADLPEAPSYSLTSCSTIVGLAETRDGHRRNTSKFVRDLVE